MKKIKSFLSRHIVILSFYVVIGCGWLFGLLDKASAGLLMAGTSPAFASVPPSNFTPGALTAANTATDGTGTTALLATAPAVSGGGSLVERIRCMRRGTNVATVVRVFLNNGSSAAVAANNSLIAERTMPANTLSQVAESVAQDIVINQILKGHASTPERIYVSIGTAVAAGIQFTPLGGDL